jgi:predicted MFS family arabinose efflux permease
MTASPNLVAPTGLPPRAWLIVGLLWVAGFLNYLDRNMIVTMRGSVTAAIPMTDAQFGLLTSVFLWVYAGLSPFAGYLADRFSRSRVIIASLFIWSVVTWLTGHATTFPQLLTARALMGISEACYIPAALALITDFHRGATRSRATALHLTGITTGAGMGGIGGWIAERHDWSYAFFLFGFIGVAHAVLMFFLLRDAPRESTEAAPKTNFVEAIASLFSRGSFFLLLVIWSLLGLAGWALIGWLPTYLGERFHLTQGAAGFSATGYLAVACFFGVLIGGAWADRWSLTNPRARILVPIIGLCIAAPGTFLAAYTHSFPLAITGVMLYGAARYFTDANMMPVLCLVADPRYRATGFGVLNLAACVVGGLAIYAGGALRDAKVDVSHMFQFAAAGLLLCAVLFAFVKPSAAHPEKS